MNKLKDILTAAVVFTMIAAVPVLNAVIPDIDVSKSERRHMSKMPELNLTSVFNSSYSANVEKYLLDNFFARDSVRTMTASVRYNLLRQSDSSGIYLINGSAVKLNYNFRSDNVKASAQKINSLYETYMKDAGCRVFYSVIPDKSSYVPEKYGYPSIDFENFEAVMQQNVKNAQYIPIYDCLKLEDYFTTDSHWRQEKLSAVMSKISSAMNFYSAFDENDYTVIELSPFYGVYYGQSALPLKYETLAYMTNAEIENAEVYNFETNKSVPVYNTEDFNNIDPYDTYLDGACALMTITNPKAASDRELIMFRDSFGSSIAPLFIHEYKKITLVDIRYIASRLIGDYVNFENSDVLFLWSASVINSTGIFK